MSGNQILGLVGIVAVTIIFTTFIVLKSVEQILWHSKWLEKERDMLFEYTEGEEGEDDGKEQK